MTNKHSNPFLVDPTASFKLSALATSLNNKGVTDKQLKKELKKLNKALRDLQHRLFAEDKRSLLLVFQAMDAAGKDSTIRAVLKGVNPAGC